MPSSLDLLNSTIIEKYVKMISLLSSILRLHAQSGKSLVRKFIISCLCDPCLIYFSQASSGSALFFHKASLKSDIKILKNLLSHSRPKELHHLSQRIQCMIRHTIMPAQYHDSGSPQRYSLWLLFWFDVEFIFHFNVNCPWISVLLFYNDFYFDNAMISTLFYFQLFFFLCFAVMFHFTFSFELFFLLFFIQS